MTEKIMKAAQVLAIDIGGTAAKYAVVSPAGEISASGSFGTVGLPNFDAFLQELYAVVQAAYAQGITKVGISSPGVYDAQGNCIGNVENLPYLSAQNIPQAVQARFAGVQCKIGNDGVGAAMGEYHFGAAKGCPSFICITLGTGIGGAYVLDGKPHLGYHGQSCEVGYFNYQSQADYYEKKYSTKGILRFLASKLQQPLISGRVFTQKVQEGAPIYTETYEEWVDAIGQLIANMALVIDPAMVVVGGGISREKALLKPALEAALARHLPPAFQHKITLEMARCGNDAGLLGAATFYLDVPEC
ncbi:MAG: ROK family protein [Faecalibacterium sp.]